ncbi:hypothetical protein CBR_g67302, partial [Chara braunii]
MSGGIGDSSGKVLTLDDLIEAMDKRERTPSNVPKVDTFHFKGERVSDWLDLVEQALVGLTDTVKFQRIMKYVLHGHHQEVRPVVDDANGNWAKFREGMQRKYRLGDGLLTTADLEAMNKDDFTTIGAFLQEFKKRARKVHGISEEAQCAIFLGLLTAPEASELTSHGGGNAKLTWATIDKGVEDGSLDQVEQHQVHLQRQETKERDASASGTPRVKKIITEVLTELDSVIQRKVTTAVQGKAKEAVVEEAAQEGWEEEEPVPPHLTKVQRKQRNLAQGGQGSGKGQVPQAMAAASPSMSAPSRGLCEEVKEWRANLPKVFLYDSGPESMLGRPGVATVGSGPRSGMMTRPPTPQGRLAQAARTRGQAKAIASQEPPRKEPEPGKRKETVEVEDDDEDEEEDERLRQEEDQRAEQRARKRESREEAEPVLHDVPPKKKKYAVRLEEGFDVKRVIDRLLEGHNDLMTLKEILASAPRLRNELKDTGVEMNIIREADAIKFGLEIDRSDCGILHGANNKALFCGTASNVLLEIGRVNSRACFFVMSDVDHSILLGRSFLCRTETLMYNKHDGSLILILCDPSCGNYEVITCRNTRPRSLRNRPNPGSFTIEESEEEHRRLMAEPEEEVGGEAFSLSLADVNKAMDIVATHEMADLDAIQTLREQVLEYPQVGEMELVYRLPKGRMDPAMAQAQARAADRPVTAMHTPRGLIHMNVAPQGWTNAVAMVRRHMIRVMQTVSPHITQPYIDDLAVKGPRRRENDEVLPGVRRFVWKHVQDLDKVLGLLEEYNLTASGAKSKHCMREATILGFVCNESGRRPDEGEAIEDTPPVDGFLDQEEDIRLHINKWFPRVPSCVGHPIWHAPKGYERKAELVLKPFEEEDPWGSKDVQWMAKLALAGYHCLVEAVTSIEEGPDRVRRHEELTGGMYLLVNTLLQESFDLESSLNPAEKGDTIPESQDDEFEEGEIKEAFRAEEYDGIYLELGLLLSCEMRDRDASDRAQRMRDCYLVRDGHLFVRRQSRLRPRESLHPRLEREVGPVVHLDWLFMPLEDHGYNYIFDARDNLFGFVDGRAIRAKTGPVLVSCMEEYYLRYPFVREFVMDRGSEFTCQEVQELLSWYGVVANYTTAAHPQANAPVERGHSTITTLLAKWAEGKPSQWPRYLRAAFFVENITVKRTTKYASATLWYGRHATFPIESFLKTWRRQDLEVNLFFEELLDIRARQVGAIEERVQEESDQVERSRMDDKVRWDQSARVRKVPLAVGDIVLLYDSSLEKHWPRKLDKRWLGPYRIVRCGEFGAYQIEELNGTEWKDWVSGTRLKKFVAREEVTEGGLRGSPLHPQEETPASGGPLQELEAHLDVSQWREPPMSERRVEPVDEVLRGEVPDPEHEEGPSTLGGRAEGEVIEVEEDTPPQTPAVGLRLGSPSKNAPSRGEESQKEDPPALPETVPSPGGTEEGETERASRRREADTLIDSHLAAHALEHPDLEEPMPVESPQEPCQAEREVGAGVPEEADRRTEERVPAGETVEEKRVRVERCWEEIGQERQRLEEAGALPDPPPPYRPYGLREMWEEFLEQYGKGLTAPDRAEIETSRKADEYLDRRIRSVSKTSFNRYMMLEANLRGKELRETGIEAQMEAVEAEARELRTLVASQAAIIQDLRQQRGSGVDGAKSSRQGEQRQPGRDLSEWPSTADPRREAPMGRVILEPKEAEAKREAERETFEFRAPTELAMLPTATADPTMPPSVEEGLPTASGEPVQGSTGGSMDVLLEAGEHRALQCPKFLKDLAEGKVSKSGGKMYDRQGRIVERSADGGRAQLYRQNQEEM